MEVFRQFNFDYNKMVEMFVEVQDVVLERKNVQRLKEEVDQKFVYSMRKWNNWALILKI